MLIALMTAGMIDIQPVETIDLPVTPPVKTLYYYGGTTQFTLPSGTSVLCEPTEDYHPFKPPEPIADIRDGLGRWQPNPNQRSYMEVGRLPLYMILPMPSQVEEEQ